MELCAAFPQGLKPTIFLLFGGMAEAMPFQNRVMKQLLSKLINANERNLHGQ
jgi:hypothetical protein